LLAHALAARGLIHRQDQSEPDDAIAITLVHAQNDGAEVRGSRLCGCSVGVERLGNKRDVAGHRPRGL
jgi:hypothetical protein